LFKFNVCFFLTYPICFVGHYKDCLEYLHCQFLYNPYVMDCGIHLTILYILQRRLLGVIGLSCKKVWVVMHRRAELSCFCSFVYASISFGIPMVIISLCLLLSWIKIQVSMAMLICFGPIFVVMCCGLFSLEKLRPGLICTQDEMLLLLGWKQWLY